jgi:hypothetical protein
MSDSAVCPEYGSKNVVPIIYGYPSAELVQKEKEDKVRLGGCCITPTAPKYACNECNCAWGGEKPVGKGYEGIRYFKAYVRRYSGPNYHIEINIISGKVKWSEGLYKETEYEKKVDVEDIKQFIEELSKCHVLKWGQKYVKPYVLDGTQWSIEIEFDDICIYKSGNNAYPKEWKKFCKLVKDLIGKPFNACLLLEKTGAPITLLVFGNDRRVSELWSQKYGNLVKETQFFFLDANGRLERLK